MSYDFGSWDPDSSSFFKPYPAHIVSPDRSPFGPNLVQERPFIWSLSPSGLSVAPLPDVAFQEAPSATSHTLCHPSKALPFHCHQPLRPLSFIICRLHHPLSKESLRQKKGLPSMLPHHAPSHSHHPSKKPLTQLVCYDPDASVTSLCLVLFRLCLLLSLTLIKRSFCSPLECSAL